MLPIISVLIILSLSLLVIRIATTILMHTGMSRESARFQARSAFTGVGFTTSESESMMTHPIRRRVTMILMLCGNAGIVTVLASVLLTFLGDRTPEAITQRLGVLLLGLVVLWLVSSSRWVDRILYLLISWILKHTTQLDLRDYSSLLHLADNHEIVELAIEDSDWIANKTLKEVELAREGMIVIGINRKEGGFVGAPYGPTIIRPGDVLMIYGRSDSIKELDERRSGYSGDLAHQQAINEQVQILSEQVATDPDHVEDEEADQNK